MAAYISAPAAVGPVAHLIDTAPTAGKATSRASTFIIQALIIGLILFFFVTARVDALPVDATQTQVAAPLVMTGAVDCAFRAGRVVIVTITASDSVMITTGGGDREDQEQADKEDGTIKSGIGHDNVS